MRRGLFSFTLSSMMLVVAAGWAAELEPGSDWCTAVQLLAPGEELVLRPGDYPGGCTIWHGGREGAPIVIRGSDPAVPSRLVYLGAATNVINIRASHVKIQNLAFGPTRDNVDGVRIYGEGGRDVAIEDCVFTDLGGIALVANHTVHGLQLRRNRILKSRSTAVYLGCHDGTSCQVTGAVFEWNYIHAVDAPPPAIGYGIQIKLNSEAIIRDNAIVDTKGPGIMVYGASDALRLSVVERNFVAGSRTSSAIVIGGGPSLVRNNVAVRSSQAGIGVIDYGRRSLLRGISILHNTIWGNKGGGIAVVEVADLDVTLIGNAVHAGSRALPAARTGITSVGNADCSRLPCFQNPWGDDFGPLAIPTLTPGLGRDLVEDDYYRRARPMAATPGAIEPPGRPIRPGIKDIE